MKIATHSETFCLLVASCFC